MKIEFTTSSPQFSAWRFVAAAVAKDASRYAINLVKVEANLIVATDGHHLHAAHMAHPFELGYYEVIKNTKTRLILVPVDDTAKFPAWQDILPHHQTYFELCSGNGDNFTTKTIGCLAKHNIGIQPAYLRPLNEIHCSWKIFYGDFAQVIRFTTYIRHQQIRFDAMIMPVNLQYDRVDFKTKAIRRHLAKTNK